MSSKHKKDFTDIIKDIVINDKFMQLDNELHHGLTRYQHSLRVAKITYNCTKALGLDYKGATRAAMLHDFYIDSDFQDLSINKFCSHPSVALKNAKAHYNLSKKEENIIASHMFPICHVAPRYAESWIVTAIDKSVAIYEMYRYKLSLALAVWMIFVFNMITLQK